LISFEEELLMLKVGDKLIAKLDFMIEDGKIPVSDREFEVIESERGCIKIRNKQGYQMIMDSSYVRESFYLTDNINYELMKLIETDKIEFVSFEGVTIDGKVIDIRKS
jgi:hypothetical protein